MSTRSVGSRNDFAPAFQRSRWAEDHTAALFAQAGLVAVHYGASTAGISAGASAEERASYQEWFSATERNGKRPDILVFTSDDYASLRERFADAGGPLIDRLESLTEDQIPPELVGAAIAAVEVENSTYVVEMMAAFGKPSPRKFRGTPYDGIGFTASAQCPRIFLKDEDKTRLEQWRARYGVPLFIAAFFADRCYLLDFRRAEQAIADDAIPAEEQTYSSREVRTAYRIWYTLAEEFAEVLETPELRAQVVVSSGGKVSADVVFAGGRFRLRPEAIAPLAL